MRPLMPAPEELAPQDTGAERVQELPPQSAGDLFIVDNSDETWKGLKYLHDWTQIASAC